MSFEIKEKSKKSPFFSIVPAYGTSGPRGEAGPQSTGLPEACDAWGSMSGMKSWGWLWLEGAPSVFLTSLLPRLANQPKQTISFLNIVLSF